MSEVGYGGFWNQYSPFIIFLVLILLLGGGGGFFGGYTQK